LGRGLDALLPKKEPASGQRRLPVADLVPTPWQPRSHPDRAAIDELAASIADKGVLQPLLVRPVGDRFEIVAGERRYRAAMVAGLDTVPVVVRDLSDQETLEIAIVENLQREDLSAIDEAEAYAKLMTFGLDQAGVARAVGKSRSAVANALRLLAAPEAVRLALQEGRITAGHARAVLAQPEEDRAWALANIEEFGLNVRQAESLHRAPAVEAKPSNFRDADVGDAVRRLEEDLARHVGGPVKIRGGRKGKIELHYRSEEELERLLDLLGYRA
jgi:ParB family chromosome partitioning protein